jgi:hypothetical protein
VRRRTFLRGVAAVPVVPHRGDELRQLRVYEPGAFRGEEAVTATSGAGRFRQAAPAHDGGKIKNLP